MTDRKEIEKLIEKELAEANEKYPLFHSPHEAWAVLTEECDELADDVEEIKLRMKDMWNEVRYDTNIEVKTTMIYRVAISAAAEAIQVAAMCKKIKQSGLY